MISRAASWYNGDMKIKKSKTMTIKKGADNGSSAIADRFKLEPAAGASGTLASSGTVGRTSALCALVAGFVSLALVGSLAIVLLFHWLFLMPA